MKPKAANGSRASKNGTAKLSAVVAEVIRLGDAVRTYWDTELPKRHVDYPFVSPGEDSGPPPPEEEQLRSLLSRLPGDAVYTLLALLRVGHRTVDPGDFPSVVRAARVEFATPGEGVDFLGPLPSLADELRDGLAVLAANGMDVDKLTPKPTASRK